MAKENGARKSRHEWNIDQNVQTPRQHFRHRTPEKEPCDRESHSKDNQTVACIVERPDVLEMLPTVGIWQQG